MQTLGIFVKQPVAGRVKSRLAKGLGEAAALRVYTAFLDDLLLRFRRVADRRALGYTPATSEAAAEFYQRGGENYELWPQPDVGLGKRMQCFFAEHLRNEDDRAVLIGSDSPTLPVAYVEQAFAALEHADCVLGPATDGGYYLIGQKGHVWPIFEGIEWSQSRVLEQTVVRLESAGARLALLPPWYDVDTLDDYQLLRGHLRALQLAGTADEFPATRQVIESLSMEPAREE